LTSDGRALELCPTAGAVLVALGQSYSRLGRVDDARGAYERALGQPTAPKPLPVGWNIWTRVDQVHTGDKQILELSSDAGLRGQAQAGLAALPAH
jgi:hypothetical protein